MERIGRPRKLSEYGASQGSGAVKVKVEGENATSHITDQSVVFEKRARSAGPREHNQRGARLAEALARDDGAEILREMFVFFHGGITESYPDEGDSQVEFSNCDCVSPLTPLSFE